MNRIVGGTDALTGRYPYMVGLLRRPSGVTSLDPVSNDFFLSESDYLRYDNYSEEQYDYYEDGGNPNQFCGGSLISSNVVLTAAHCVDSRTPEDLEVALGCTDISEVESCTLSNVTDIVIHPDWQLAPGTFGDDIAILFLAEDLEFETVTLASPTIFPQNGDIVRNIGWGRTVKITNPPSKRLQEVTVAVVENDICLDQMADIFNVRDVSAETYNETNPYFYNIFKGDNYIERGNLDTVICTIGDGKSSCNGDSGGPLFYPCDTEGVADIQIGVVSFGFSCGGEGVPIGFEAVNSVAAFNFIVETLNDFNIEDVKFVDTVDGFCPEDPIDQVDSPTPFPTFVAGKWTCVPFFFSANDGCDCGCGQPDPDCEVQSRKSLLFGCDVETEICVEGKCVPESDSGDDNDDVDEGDDNDDDNDSDDNGDDNNGDNSDDVDEGDDNDEDNSGGNDNVGDEEITDSTSIDGMAIAAIVATLITLLMLVAYFVFDKNDKNTEVDNGPISI